ncbi:MAG: hypothetical protein HY784_04975 [Chloroflexi bacterium]|nr:hypothetical protein [Chloroflexota bacterium]
MTRTAPSRRRAPARPWPVTALGLLLLLQSAALFGLGVITLLAVSLRLQITLETVAGELPHALRGIFFVALALTALLTASGFFRLRRGAWLNAMFLQGLSLLMALGIYLRDKPQAKLDPSYLMMLYGIFMVIYLNHDEVLAAFRPKPVFLDRGQDR